MKMQRNGSSCVWGQPFGLFTIVWRNFHIRNVFSPSAPEDQREYSLFPAKAARISAYIRDDPWSKQKHTLTEAASLHSVCVGGGRVGVCFRACVLLIHIESNVLHMWLKDVSWNLDSVTQKTPWLLHKLTWFYEFICIMITCTHKNTFIHRTKQDSLYCHLLGVLQHSTSWWMLDATLGPS